MCYNGKSSKSKRKKALLLNRQNSANGLALTGAYLLIMICQVLIPRYFHNGSAYLICTLVWLLGALAMLFLNRRFSFKNPVDSAEKCTQAAHEAILIGLGLVATLAAQLLLTSFEVNVLHQPSGSENTNMFIEIIHQYPYYFLCPVIAAPITEELVFRKFFFGNFSSVLPKPACALISSTAFSMCHGDGHFIVYAAIGLILCYVYERSGRIRTGMIVHMLMNLTVMLINL